MSDHFSRRRFLKVAAGAGAYPVLRFAPRAAHGADGNALRLAVFSADVTPPLRQRACVGFIKEFVEVEHPLLAKGIVLHDADGRYVICAVDYCGLCNDSYDLFRARIAEAAGTTMSRVAVHTVHQHTAPVFDANAERILYAGQAATLALGAQAEEAAAGRIAAAVERTRGQERRVTHVSGGMAHVDRVASNRRVPQPDGSIASRSSAAAGDPAMRDAPEGLIDPWLRTITFYEQNDPLVRLHYYATHPQTTSGGRVTYDVPGLARERLEKETSTPQVYFTACGGNITMGKTNDGSAEARAALAERMHQGIQAAAANCDQNPRVPATHCDWRTRPIRLPLREGEEFTLAAARQMATDPGAAFSERLRKAMLVAWIERVQADRPIELTAWSVGETDVVHLPAEPFVQFQLAAQRACPNRFVCVAGYGDCAPWYLGEDRIYTDRGGYEQSWAFAGPCERLLKASLQALLAGRSSGYNACGVLR